jgi:predicted HAD superfamily Cof-like phosphohydrolase
MKGIFMDDLKERLLKVEISIDSLYDSVSELRRSNRLLTDELAGIQKNLTQIKYFAMGALALMTVDKIGLLEVAQIAFGGM